MCQDDNKIMTVFGDNPTVSKTRSGAGAQRLSVNFDILLTAETFDVQSFLQQTIRPDSGLRTPDLLLIRMICIETKVARFAARIGQIVPQHGE
ncbi:hypothetical protein GX51_04369 [Blastomyces parvus]|uniref:Uncharacterized protein n=1 Tax=Blastomyces parvus TaxID=2060905 RepID=A0A2B7X291_9EURO|nr:hypothetical protein GX51_04369 [Blastomyces parvus]